MPLDLDGLNTFFWQWLEQEYHRRKHSALEMSPLDKYLSQVSEVKMVEDPASLKLLFLKRDYRKVRHDGTISLHNHLFEVPPLWQPKPYAELYSDIFEAFDDYPAYQRFKEAFEILDRD